MTNNNELVLANILIIVYLKNKYLKTAQYFLSFSELKTSFFIGKVTHSVVTYQS
jgi:hypothetical protein